MPPPRTAAARPFARRAPARRRPPARKARPAPRRRDPESYAELSKRPLHILAFLAPLVVLYEIGSILYLTGDQGYVDTIRAYRLLAGFFHAFGVGGLYLPGVLLAGVLLLWHVLTRDRWRIDLSVLSMMLLESVLWALPLIVIGQIFARFAMPGAEALAAVAQPTLAEMPSQARLTIALGAGLYEELLFRLLGVTLLHMIAADVLRLPQRAAVSIAVIGSALAFALYHQPFGSGEPRDWAVFAFQLLAGAYFGGLFIGRGFGVVVATHAIYDVVVLVILS